MPTGLLAGGSLTGTLTSYYVCPSGTTAFVTVNIANRTTGNVTVRINLSTTTGENLGGYLEFDSTIAANQAIEKTGIVLAAGQRILISSNSTNTTYRIYGYERTD
jgi:hypothetical protein